MESHTLPVNPPALQATTSHESYGNWWTTVCDYFQSNRLSGPPDAPAGSLEPSSLQSCCDRGTGRAPNGSCVVSWPRRLLTAQAVPFFFCLCTNAAIQITVDCNPSEEALPEFKFSLASSPARNDAAAQAGFAVVDGRLDPNGGGLVKLHDGRMPTDEDQPSENCFFRAGADGGRLLIDLRNVIDISQINTYSWHPNNRAPQVYTLFASEGTQPDFNSRPLRGTNPITCGWTHLANIDTRKSSEDSGGQYGVCIFDSSGIVGRYRYLLLDVFRTENDDNFGNTFFSEIDVIQRNGPALERVASNTLSPARETVLAGDGKYQIMIDTTETPDLTGWAKRELVPLVQEWYPKLIEMLPSEGFVPPKRLSIIMSQTMRGPAATSGTRIRCGASFIRENLNGEAKGAIFHEIVHVVQQYGRAPKGSPPPPGWLTEGIADYLRWYHFEPHSRWAGISASNVPKARYDGSYRVSANFLDWVSRKFDPQIARKLNAVLRQGKPCDPVWKEATGHTASELGNQWKQSLAQQVNLDSQSPKND